MSDDTLPSEANKNIDLESLYGLSNMQVSDRITGAEFRRFRESLISLLGIFENVLVEAIGCRVGEIGFVGESLNRTPDKVSCKEYFRFVLLEKSTKGHMGQVSNSLFAGLVVGKYPDSYLILPINPNGNDFEGYHNLEFSCHQITKVGVYEKDGVSVSEKEGTLSRYEIEAGGITFDGAFHTNGGNLKGTYIEVEADCAVNLPPRRNDLAHMNQIFALYGVHK